MLQRDGMHRPCWPALVCAQHMRHVQAVLLPLMVSPAVAAPSASEDLRRMMNMAAPLAARGSYDTLGPAQRNAGINPSEAAAFRLQLMRSGDLPEAQLRSISVPTTLLCSNKDRLFPSMEEGASAPPTAHAFSSMADKESMDHALAQDALIWQPVALQRCEQQALIGKGPLCAVHQLLMCVQAPGCSG